MKKVLFFVFWILCSAISLIGAYWLMGAIPVTEDGVSYISRLLYILNNPFANYFNEYTPIGMVAIFIVVELIFGVLFISKITLYPINEQGIDMDSQYEDEEKNIKIVEKENPIVKEVQFSNSIQTENVFSNDSEKELPAASIKDELEDKDDDTSEVVLEEETFLKLFNAGYSMEQINAMMEITEYIPSVDHRQLIKMVNPAMSASEIRSYVEMFFG